MKKIKRGVSLLIILIMFVSMSNNSLASSINNKQMTIKENKIVQESIYDNTTEDEITIEKEKTTVINGIDNNSSNIKFKTKPVVSFDFLPDLDEYYLGETPELCISVDDYHEITSYFAYIYDIDSNNLYLDNGTRLNSNIIFKGSFPKRALEVNQEILVDIVLNNVNSYRYIEKRLFSKAPGPENMEVSDIESNSAVLTFDKFDRATDYKVELNNEIVNIYSNTQDKPQIELKELLPNQEYEVKVTTVINGIDNNSSSINFKTKEK